MKKVDINQKELEKIRRNYLETKKELETYKWGHKKSKRGLRILYKDLEKETAKRKKGEERLKKALEKQKEIDRMQNEFISIVSHQLNTPLVGVRWTIERILKKEKLTIGLQGYLQDVRVSVQRLSDLVNNLLNTSRFEEGRLTISPKQIELVALIKDYIVECTPLFIKKGVDLTLEEHPQTLNIVTDHNLLQNVVQSLVSNAIEYTPKGGRVKVFLKKKDGHLLFTVSDTGIGIPKEEQTTIFNKFTRGTNAKLIKPSGSGLGLFLAKQAAELLGGKIWFKSIKDKGTTFYVELPLKARSKKGSKSLA